MTFSKRNFEREKSLLIGNCVQSAVKVQGRANTVQNDEIDEIEIKMVHREDVHDKSVRKIYKKIGINGKLKIKTATEILQKRGVML